VAGTIYHHSQLVFHNGFVGKKFLIQLNHPREREPLLFVKTTSQSKGKPFIDGCIKEQSVFFIPTGSSFFEMNTWVQLYEIYEMNQADVLSNADIMVVGKLSCDQIKAIIDCLFMTQAEDISDYHKDLINPPMQSALLKLQEKYRKKH
jgi:hypothetical protein